MTIKLHISLQLCLVSSSSILIPWRHLVRPSHCLPAPSAAFQNSCGPCPNFLAPAVSVKSRAGDPCSVFTAGSGRNWCVHRLTFRSRSASKNSFFSLSVVQDIPATLVITVVTAFFASGLVSCRHPVLYSAGKVDKHPCFWTYEASRVLISTTS